MRTPLRKPLKSWGHVKHSAEEKQTWIGTCQPTYRPPPNSRGSSSPAWDALVFSRTLLCSRDSGRLWWLLGLGRVRRLRCQVWVASETEYLHNLHPRWSFACRRLRKKRMKLIIISSYYIFNFGHAMNFSIYIIYLLAGICPSYSIENFAHVKCFPLRNGSLLRSKEMSPSREQWQVMKN